MARDCVAIARIAISICIVIALRSTDCNAEQINMIHDDEYLLFLRFADSFEHEISWLAEQVEQQPAENPSEILDFIQSKLIYIKENAKNGDILNDIGLLDGENVAQLLDVLQEFSMLPLSQKPIHCVIYNLEHYLSAIELLYGGLKEFANFAGNNTKPSRFAKLFGFMQYYGREHLRNCLNELKQAEKLDKIYAKGQESAHGEYRLDRMLSAWKATATNEDQLLAKARELDLHRGKFDDPRLISSLRQSGRDLDPDKSLDIGSFGADLDDSCAEFPPKIVNLIENYNLIRVLFADELANLQLSARFLKLNEYFRMCNQLTNAQIRSETLANLKRNYNLLD